MLSADFTEHRLAWIDRSPTWLASPPPSPVRELRLPTPVQFRQLYERARTYNNMLATIVALAGLTGARRGELIGLRWSDIDWEKKRLQIIHSVTEVHGVLYVGPTKTRVNRSLALDASSIYILQEERAYVDARAEAVREIIGPDAFVLSEVPDGSKPQSTCVQ
jgi:integrase